MSERDIYGGPHTATLMKLLGLTVRMVEQATGKNWDTDLETHRAMRRAIAGVLSVFDLPPETDFQQENEQLVGLRAAVKALRMAGLSKDRSFPAWRVVVITPLPPGSPSRPASLLRPAPGARRRP